MHLSRVHTDVGTCMHTHLGSHNQAKTYTLRDTQAHILVHVDVHTGGLCMDTHHTRHKPECLDTSRRIPSRHTRIHFTRWCALRACAHTRSHISQVGLQCAKLTTQHQSCREGASPPLLPVPLPCPESANSQEEPSFPLGSDSCAWQVWSLQREQIQHLPCERDFPGLAAGSLEPRSDSDLPGSTQQGLGRGKTRIQSFLKG